MGFYLKKTGIIKFNIKETMKTQNMMIIAITIHFVLVCAHGTESLDGLFENFYGRGEVDALHQVAA
jgi:hypothetical protein